MLKKIESTRGRSISVRIPLDLYAELESVKEQAEAEGHTVSITEAVTEAVRKVCKDAKSELVQMKMQDQAKRDRAYDKAQKEMMANAP